MIPCEVTLENYRSVLFEELKEMDDFPFGLQCERHVHTRNGDPVAVKLTFIRLWQYSKEENTQK